MHHRLIASFSFLPILLIAARDAGAQSRPDPFDAAVRRLGNAVRSHSDGRHIDLLASLRSLHDASLAPFFSRLTSNEDPVIQVNGILGLAEISPEERIDPWLVGRLPNEAAKLQALNLAIGLELIDPAQMSAMLASEDIEETVRVALLAELVSLGESIEPAALEDLATSENQKVRAVAAMLRTQVMADRAPFEQFRAELDQLSPEERRYAHLWLASDAGQYRLTEMLWWLDEVAATAMAADEELASVAVQSALLLDPSKGAPLWQAMLANDPSHPRRVAHGLILLDAAREVAIPATLFDEIRDGQELTEKIADAGSALATSRESAAEPLIALLSLDHWRSASDAAASAEFLPPEQAAQVYATIIRRAFDPAADPSLRGPRQELAIRAVPLLFEVDPDAVSAFLDEVADDSAEQEIILIGLLGCDDPRAAALARNVKRLGFGAADCLALLLIAKHTAAGELAEPETRDLGMLAAGGGRLSPGLAAEAAWLYIKHTGKIELAMSRLFAAEQD